MQTKKIKFYFYKGKSLTSKLIKYRTYSDYSHVAIGIDNKIFESWRGGVVCSNDPLKYHTKNTKFDYLEVEMMNWKPWSIFLNNQIGKKYDFKAIFNFLFNKKNQNPDKFFCSELAETFFVFEFKNYRNDRLVSPQTFYDMIKILKLVQNQK